MSYSPRNLTGIVTRSLTVSLIITVLKTTIIVPEFCRPNNSSFRCSLVACSFVVADQPFSLDPRQHSKSVPSIIQDTACVQNPPGRLFGVTATEDWLKFWRVWPCMAPPWGLLTPRTPKWLLQNKPKCNWSRNKCARHGFATYFACAKLHTFPMVSACALAP